VATAPSPGGISAPRHSPRAILTVLSLGSFMASLDVFIVNVALDRIGASFHGSSIADVSWVLNA
jgi:MFS family permease